MKAQLLPVVTIFLLLSTASCSLNMVDFTFDYDYPNTTLLNVSNIHGQAFRISLNFSFMHAGVSYDYFYICSHSYITFSASHCFDYSDLYSSPSIILIDAANNFASHIIVTSTSENATVDYRGRRWGPDKTGEMQWKLTFYKERFQKFGLDILSNNMLDKGRGEQAICSSWNSC